MNAFSQSLSPSAGLSPLRIAQVALTIGVVAAGGMLCLPRPQASPRFLAAHAQWTHAARQLGGTVASVPSDQRPAPTPHAVPRIAAREGTAPLAGLPQPIVRNEVASPESNGTSVPEHQLVATLPATPTLPGSRPSGLVPDPTPEPSPAFAVLAPDPRTPLETDLAQEVRSMRQELLRLAQREPTATGPATPDTGETRRLLDELRQAQQFEALQSQIRAMQSRVAPASAMPAAPNNDPATPVTAETFAAPVSPAPPSAPVIQTIPGGQADRFSLKVDNAPVGQVLDLLGQMAGWNVVLAPEVTGTVTLNLRDVTLDEGLSAVLTPRDLVSERKENLLFVLPRGEAVARAAAARVVVTKVYRPHYVAVKDLLALITPLLSPGVGKAAITAPSLSGLALSAAEAGGDSLSQRDALVVQDYQTVIEEIDRLLVEMDVPPRQVVIEAVILKVRLDDSLRFGVNFALLGDSGRQLVTIGSGAAIGAATGFPGAAAAGAIAPGAANPGFLSQAPGLKYGLLRGDVAAFVEALENISETSLVASPQLRALNKQKAELIIGQRLGYRTQTFQNQQTIENVQFLDVGTKLVLRPFVAPDGLVRMEIHPERSTGFIDDNGLPQIDTTEVTTNVMVRDGATVVIGGLIDEQVEENVSQIPLLGSIPYAGNLFKNKLERVVRNELIVLITPRIVCDDVEEVRGEVVRNESERRAAEFADTLSPISRTNLARLHVRRAQEHFARGRLTDALDSVEHALAIRANEEEAIRLKGQIEAALSTRTRQVFGLPPVPAPLPSESLFLGPPPNDGCPLPTPVLTPAPLPPLPDAAPVPEPADPFAPADVTGPAFPPVAPAVP